jgi:hypothetical protein
MYEVDIRRGQDEVEYWFSSVNDLINLVVVKTEDDWDVGWNYKGSISKEVALARILSLCGYAIGYLGFNEDLAEEVLITISNEFDHE